MEEFTPRPILEINTNSFERLIENKYVLSGSIFEEFSVNEFMECSIFLKELGQGTNSVTSLYSFEGSLYVVRFVNDYLDKHYLENEIMIYKTLFENKNDYCLNLQYADISCGHFSNSYFIFTYEEGQTLYDYLQSQSVISLEFAFHLASNLEKAVREFHTLGILHRDIKPANIFLRKDTWIPCIFDFSDALYLSNESIQSPQSEYVGSPKYSHPHILQQKKTFYPTIFRPEYDMYAIGIILKDDIAPRVRRISDRQEVMWLANYFLDIKQWS